MDLRILDAQFNDLAVAEGYLSRIWSTRYSAYGDFEIQSIAGSDLASYFRSGSYIVDLDSNTGMFIETEEPATDVDDIPVVSFKGRSFEVILDRRIIWGRKKISGNIQDIIAALIDEAIINPTIPERKVDNFVFRRSTNLQFDECNLSEPIDLDGDSLYDIVKMLCDAFGAGFKIEFDNDLKQLTFMLYFGRILDGTAYDGGGLTVEFSPGYENLQSSRYLRDTQSYKSVVLVSSDLEIMAEQNNEEGDSSASTRITAATESFVSFVLAAGSKIAVRFHKKVNAGATLDINGTGARPIFYNGSAIQNDVISGSGTVLFQYDGAHYVYVANYKESERITERLDQVVVSNQFDAMGINRREIYVEASVETEENMTREEYLAKMRRQGSETLNEHSIAICMDGQVISDGNQNYLYARDYLLGDVVLVDDYLGNRGSARITEYVQSDDTDNGEQAYPTFSIIS